MMHDFTLHLFYFFKAKDYEVARDDLTLDEIIGQGQFGDVYQGTFKSKVSRLTFKTDNEN